jgi:hypothetical protein
MVDALARKAVMASDVLGDAMALPEVAGMTPANFCELLRTGRLPDSDLFSAGGEQ